KWKVESSLLTESAEKELYEAIINTQHGTQNTVNEALSIVETLIPAINNFFDTVLVMDEDEAIRNNRLALVGKIASLTDGIADLSHLEGF
ncbi:MAG TPA: glycine--tRNA ligase subunit beta, partial [Anaerolineales bacterium]|nr:glycine--tRNA ligase subunit beta [Anaerolineales bacterium]